jgi:AraC family transcriptional regulator
LLERSAWQLTRTNASVTEIALDAQYGSIEAFSRAFAKAFGVSPSLFRRMGPTHFYLGSPNGFHFCAPASASQGESNHMDLFELFGGNDSWHTNRLLDYAKNLTDDQLDHPIDGTYICPWEGPDQSLRQLLDRLVLTKEVWAAALKGGPVPVMENPPENRTPAALRARFEKADRDFMSIIGDVRKRGAWGDTFVDALCEPAETFTFGGMFASVITFNTHRRLIALEAMRRLGVKVQGYGDPMEYERVAAGKMAEPVNS